MTQTIRADLITRLEKQAKSSDVDLNELLEKWLDQHESHTIAERLVDDAVSNDVLLNQEPKENETYLRLMIDNVSDLLCLHTADGHYEFVSVSSLQVTGYTPEELIGKNPYDYFHPDDKTKVETSHQTALEGENVSSIIYRFRHKDGHYVWLESKTHPIKDKHGRVIHLVTGTRDITEHLKIQQELKQERDLLTKIMETSPSAITVVDKSGKIEFGNKRLESIFRMSVDEQVERSYDSIEWRHTDLDGEPWTDEKQPFVQVMQTGAPVYNVQHAIVAPDGFRVLLSINGAPLFDEDGEISKVVFSIEDITELKRAEQGLVELLAKEQEINTLKSRFLSIVSHEFRTPLSVILTSTDLLDHFAKDRLSPQELQRLEQIRRQVKYLDMQLDEISILNKSNHSQIQLNLEQMFVLDMLHQLIAETRLRYNYYQPIHVNTPHTVLDTFLLDPLLIQHIFTNLISNAIKYSKEDGEISIILTCTSQQFFFSIKDQGIGIRLEDQDNLFDFFFRGDNVGGINGTGIGLAVVHQSVKLHGGNIEFESEEGLGSTFSVTIPFLQEGVSVGI